MNHSREDLTLPTIHMNGTGAQTLVDDYLTARSALIDAETALQKVEFNARDYYTQGDTAWTKARAERMEWFKALAKMQDHCLAIAMHAQEKGGLVNDQRTCAFCFPREQGTYGEIKREWSQEWLQFIPVCRLHAKCDGMDQATPEGKEASLAND